MTECEHMVYGNGECSDCGSRAVIISTEPPNWKLTPKKAG